MPVQPSGNLTIYVLNVSQADTSVIITPQGNILIIDAVRPDKLVNLLGDIGLNDNDEIAELIITHPHVDHFSGANRLIDKYNIKSVTLSPFWNKYGTGPPSYRTMINEIERKRIPVDFISGYSRFYPDTDSYSTQSNIDPKDFYIELLGPSNNLIGGLERCGNLDTNHLSIMSRLNWKNFRMIFAADAQMENWACFDQEGMLESNCNILRTAHHGSCNGTQWERLYRLKPRCVIVSANPDKSHNLPDLIGTSIFAKYSLHNSSNEPKKIVALTSSTGSIRITKSYQGRYKLECFKEEPDDYIDINTPKNLSWSSNPTDWETLLSDNARNFYT